MLDVLFLGGIVATYVIFIFFNKWCEKQVDKINN